jgi:hypothetical protein
MDARMKEPGSPAAERMNDEVNPAQPTTPALRIADHVAYLVDGGDTYVARLADSTVHRLTGTASEIWGEVAKEPTADGLVGRMAARHPEVDAIRLADSVNGFLAELEALRLVVGEG